MPFGRESVAMAKKIATALGAIIVKVALKVLEEKVTEILHGGRRQ